MPRSPINILGRCTVRVFDVDGQPLGMRQTAAILAMPCSTLRYLLAEGGRWRATVSAVRRTGKPYIFATWLAKILGGQQCVFSPWFKAHYRYDKYEEQAMDLVKWNRDHTALMARRRRQLEAEGWTVTSEEQNAFKLEGASAIVAGKPDLVATKDGQVLVVDGKTGRQRESDIWQVLFYLYAIPKSRPDLQGDLVGEVEYKSGDVITVTPDELQGERMAQLVDLIQIVAGETPPKRTPSRQECRSCNIGPKDCPQRVQAEETTAVGDF